MAAFSVDTGLESLGEDIDDGTQLVIGHFVSCFDKERLQEAETFVGSRAGLGLKVLPNGIIQWVQIRAVGGSFGRGDEICEVNFAEGLSKF